MLAEAEAELEELELDRSTAAQTGMKRARQEEGSKPVARGRSSRGVESCDVFFGL
jgi:hypothetical protein